MKAPLCRVCQHAHYSYEPHVWPQEPSKPKQPKAPKPAVANTAPVANSSVANSSPVANKRYEGWRQRNPDLYRQRQRELMRRKRAAA